MTTFHFGGEVGQGGGKAVLCKLKSNLKLATFHFLGGGKVALLPCWGNLANLTLTFGTQSV